MPKRGWTADSGRPKPVPPPAPRIYVRRTLKDFQPPTPQPTLCRLWQGSVDRRGYGLRPDHQRVARWVWEQCVGPIPEGLQVCHHCDNPPCYRLSHLWLGSIADNAADRVAKGRTVLPGLFGESHPQAKLTEVDVLAIRAASAAGETHPVIALRYGINRGTVSKITRRKTWRHI